MIPAHQDLLVLTFLRTTYIPGSREPPWPTADPFPTGAPYYQSKIAEFTTTEPDPGSDPPLIGLSEGAAIRGRMLAVIKEVGFAGDLRRVPEESARPIPRFYVTTPAGPARPRRLDRQRSSTARRATGSAGCPRTPRFTIRPVPADPGAVLHRGPRRGPGSICSTPTTCRRRPLYALTALTLHESAPGHAFQIPIGGRGGGPAGVSPQGLHLRLRRGVGALPASGSARRWACMTRPMTASAC